MAKKDTIRDEARPRKSEEELNILSRLYKVLESRRESAFPDRDDIGGEEEMKPIIVHNARKVKTIEK